MNIAMVKMEIVENRSEQKDRGSYSQGGCTLWGLSLDDPITVDKLFTVARVF